MKASPGTVTGHDSGTPAKAADTMFSSVDVVVVDVQSETSALEEEEDGAFGGTDDDETAVIVDGAESSATQAVKPNTTTDNKASRTLTIFPRDES